MRFRCCQLLARITTEFSQIPGIGEEDLERVVRVLLPRLQDKVESGSSFILGLGLPLIQPLKSFSLFFSFDSIMLVSFGDKSVKVSRYCTVALLVFEKMRRRNARKSCIS